jgi:hypothetical protein
MQKFGRCTPLKTVCEQLEAFTMHLKGVMLPRGNEDMIFFDPTFKMVFELGEKTT